MRTLSVPLMLALYSGSVLGKGKNCVAGCDGEASHCQKCDSRSGYDWSCDVCCKGYDSISIAGGHYCEKHKVPSHCTASTCSPYPAAATAGGQDAVAFRNNCTKNCPLLIMLHGAGGTGEVMAEDSAMMDKFQGIIAYPSSVPYATGWPIVANNDSNWEANMRIVQNLIALPDVDPSRVYTLGFSSGGFYSYALACAIGNQLKASVVISALKYVQPSCPHQNNILHIHSSHDTYNVPVDPPNGTKGGYDEIGYPTTLRSNWIGNLKGGFSTNGAQGATSGDFTLFSAKATGSSLTFDYWFYLNGPSRHAYEVYDNVPAGAPDGLEMESYISTYLPALP